ncbi:MAG: GAF domain-containing protein [Planctomycetes bacterium]|nr:GAF domain-containing protein [Planctomycetota bacterium]
MNRLRLTVLEEGTRTEVAYEQDPVRIGRSIDNEVRLAGKLVSRQHCRIERDGLDWYVVDLESANGTLLNGERVARALLSSGDELVLSGTRLLVQIESAPATQAPPGTSGGLATLTGGESRERFGLRAFAQIARSLSGETDLPTLLRLVVDSAIQLLKAERGFLLLEDEDQRLQPRVARQHDQSDILAPGSRLSMGVARNVYERGRPVLSVDAGRDERFAGMPSVEDLRLRSVLCVPIRGEGRVQGVLYLDNRLQQGAFTEDDLDLAELFGDQASIALRNARQLSGLKERNRQLEESRLHVARLNEQLGRKVRDRDAELSVVRAELSRARGRYDYHEIVGASGVMQKLFQHLDRVVESDLPVLIQGESGTGKELIARAIHFNGRRKDKPFVSENCAALPDSLLESELFGHTRGAFTGADRAKKGLIEQAHGGTLFLDEIGDMSPEMQKKLLRVLQEGEVRPVGATMSVKVDVRLLGASHCNLEELVKAGKFREDLYYRIKVLQIDLPPLRERAEDIPLLAEALLARAAREAQRPAPLLTPEVLAALSRCRWTGNVRELENEMRRLVVLGADVADVDSLSPGVLGGEAKAGVSGPLLRPGDDLREAVARFEKEAIVGALERLGGNKSKAAHELGISRFALQRKLIKYGLAEEEDLAEGEADAVGAEVGDADE